MTGGEKAMAQWTEAMAALKAGDYARAEAIAAAMHVTSDARLVRERIAREVFA